MQHYELKEFFTDMHLPKEEQLDLQENFYIWPIGTAYPLDTPDEQRQLLKYIDLHKIDLIIIDSHSLAMYGSIKEDDDVKRLNSFLNEDVRRDRKCSYIFIHHPRKRTGLEKSNEEDQDNVFGSRFITANAQTVMVLAQKSGSTKLHVKFLKRRFAYGLNEFEIERTTERGFQLVGQLADTATSYSIKGSATSDTQSTTGALGPLFHL
jgi:hypothetical protein